MANPFAPCLSVNKAGLNCWLCLGHRGGIHEVHPAERGKSRAAGVPPVWTDDHALMPGEVVTANEAERARLTAGSPCPDGCETGWPDDRKPELLRANEDGELSCPTCWAYFGNVSAAYAPHQPKEA